MKTSRAGIDLIKRFEGCRLEAYLCPAGVPTIGYGHTEGVKLGQRISQHQADVILEHDLERYEEGVERATKGITLTQGQFDALVSFAFNLGVGALERSTLLRKLRDGGPLAAAPEFGKWVRAGGKVLPGLVKRREAERAMFLGVQR